LVETFVVPIQTRDFDEDGDNEPATPPISEEIVELPA